MSLEATFAQRSTAIIKLKTKQNKTAPHLFGEELTLQEHGGHRPVVPSIAPCAETAPHTALTQTALETQFRVNGLECFIIPP